MQKKKTLEVIKLSKELLVCLSIFTQTNSFYNLIIFSLWCASIFDFCAKKVNTPSQLLPRTKWISLFLPNTTKGGLSRPRFNCLALTLTFCPGVNKNWGLSALIFRYGARLCFSLLCRKLSQFRGLRWSRNVNELYSLNEFTVKNSGCFTDLIWRRLNKIFGLIAPANCLFNMCGNDTFIGHRRWRCWSHYLDYPSDLGTEMDSQRPSLSSNADTVRWQATAC